MGMDFVSAGLGGQYDATSRRVAWDLTRLDAGTAAELTISVVVKDRNPLVSSIIVSDYAGNRTDTAAQVIASTQ